MFESCSRMNMTKWWWAFIPRARTDVVRCTATAPDAADLRPALPVAAADVMIRSARYYLLSK